MNMVSENLVSARQLPVNTFAIQSQSQSQSQALGKEEKINLNFQNFENKKIKIIRKNEKNKSIKENNNSSKSNNNFNKNNLRKNKNNNNNNKDEKEKGKGKGKEKENEYPAQLIKSNSSNNKLTSNFIKNNKEKFEKPKLYFSEESKNYNCNIFDNDKSFKSGFNVINNNNNNECNMNELVEDELLPHLREFYSFSQKDLEEEKELLELFLNQEKKLFPAKHISTGSTGCLNSDSCIGKSKNKQTSNNKVLTTSNIISNTSSTIINKNNTNNKSESNLIGINSILSGSPSQSEGHKQQKVFNYKQINIEMIPEEDEERLKTENETGKKFFDQHNNKQYNINNPNTFDKETNIFKQESLAEIIKENQIKKKFNKELVSSLSSGNNYSNKANSKNKFGEILLVKFNENKQQKDQGNTIQPNDKKLISQLQLQLNKLGSNTNFNNAEASSNARPSFEFLLKSPSLETHNHNNNSEKINYNDVQSLNIINRINNLYRYNFSINVDNKNTNLTERIEKSPLDNQSATSIVKKSKSKSEFNFENFIYNNNNNINNFNTDLVLEGSSSINNNDNFYCEKPISPANKDYIEETKAIIDISSNKREKDEAKENQANKRSCCETNTNNVVFSADSGSEPRAYKKSDKNFSKISYHENSSSVVNNHKNKIYKLNRVQGCNSKSDIPVSFNKNINFDTSDKQQNFENSLDQISEISIKNNNTTLNSNFNISQNKEDALNQENSDSMPCSPEKDRNYFFSSDKNNQQEAKELKSIIDFINRKQQQQQQQTQQQFCNKKLLTNAHFEKPEINFSSPSIPVSNSKSFKARKNTNSVYNLKAKLKLLEQEKKEDENGEKSFNHQTPEANQADILSQINNLKKKKTCSQVNNSINANISGFYKQKINKEDNKNFNNFYESGEYTNHISTCINSNIHNFNNFNNFNYNKYKKNKSHNITTSTENNFNSAYINSKGNNNDIDDTEDILNNNYDFTHTENKAAGETSKKKPFKLKLKTNKNLVDLDVLNIKCPTFTCESTKNTTNKSNLLYSNNNIILENSSKDIKLPLINGLNKSINNSIITNESVNILSNNINNSRIFNYSNKSNLIINPISNNNTNMNIINNNKNKKNSNNILIHYDNQYKNSLLASDSSKLRDAELSSSNFNNFTNENSPDFCFINKRSIKTADIKSKNLSDMQNAGAMIKLKEIEGNNYNNSNNNNIKDNTKTQILNIIKGKINLKSLDICKDKDDATNKNLLCNNNLALANTNTNTISSNKSKSFLFSILNGNSGNSNSISNYYNININNNNNNISILSSPNTSNSNNNCAFILKKGKDFNKNNKPIKLFENKV